MTAVIRDLIENKLSVGNPEKELLDYCNKAHNLARTGRFAFERVWYMHLAFYFGRHYAQWATSALDSTGLTTEASYSKLYEPAVPNWRVRLICNRIRTVIRGELAKVTKEKPRGFVIPSTTDEADLAGARAGEAIHEYLWRELHMNRAMRRAVFWELITGTSFVKDWYAKDDIDLDGKTKGKICAEAVTPFHMVIPDLQEPELESQPYIIHEMAKDPSWVSKHFKDKNGNPIEVRPNASSSAGGIMEQQFLSALGVAGAANSRKYVAIREGWFKPNNKFKDGLFVMWTGDQILYSKEGWPYKHGEYPFTKLEHIPTGRFYSESSIADLIPLQKEYNRCYDSSSEILTKSGWKNHSTLIIGEDVMSFNSRTGLMEWQPLLELFVNESYSGPMTVLEGSQISARTTPGHRWWVKSSTGYMKEVTKLTSDHKIPLCRSVGNLPTEVVYDDAFVELLGWVVTDGDYHPNGCIRIGQSLEANYLKCKQIQRLLDELNFKYTVDFNSNTYMKAFRILVDSSRQIKKVLPKKELNYELISSLPRHQLQRLFDGMVGGDGMVHDDLVRFYSSDEEQASQFQTICTLLGKTTSLRKQRAKSDWAVKLYQYIVTVKVDKYSDYATVFRAKKADEQYEGAVWCPTVENSWVLVRRNGRVYISGNTRSQIIEAKNRMSKPQLVAVRGSVDPNRITSEPGLIIFYTPGFAAPQPLPLQNLPGYVIDEVERIKLDMDDSASQHDISRGNAPPGVSAATAISFLQEQDDSKLLMTVASLEEGVEKIGKHFLSHVTQFWTAERMVQVTGVNGQWESYKFKSESLNGNTNFKIEAGSATPVSRAAKQAFILELMKGGYVPPEQGLKYLDMSETGRMYEEIQRDARQAQRENMKMMEGAEVLVNTFDIDLIHVQEHEGVCKTEEYESAPDEVKILFQQHLTLHRQKMALMQGMQLTPEDPKLIAIGRGQPVALPMPVGAPTNGSQPQLPPGNSQGAPQGAI